MLRHHNIIIVFVLYVIFIIVYVEKSSHNEVSCGDRALGYYYWEKNV